jgi:hypothetical protein
MALSETSQKDVADARSTQQAMLASNDRVAAHFIYWFAWFWSIVSAGYFFAVSFLPVPDSSQHYADIILGFLLGTAVATIIGYFFGNADKG